MIRRQRDGGSGTADGCEGRRKHEIATIKAWLICHDEDPFQTMELFSPGIFWMGSSLNLCGSEVQPLKMNP
jgi:hypothetical protein